MTIVKELQDRHIPSTPPKVLAERRLAVSQAAEKIKGDALCTKAADAVAIIWETLIEDDATKKIM